MKKPLKEYNIQFIGLKDGKHDFKYTIDNTFFKNFEFDEFNKVNIQQHVTLTKKPTLLELHFRAIGTVNVQCDVSSEYYNESIDSEFDLIVNFGDAFNDENEAILILPHGEYEVNIAQYIYELIVLSLPVKRVHPGVLDGTLNSEILNKLEELSPKKLEHKENVEDIDPRWDKLKKLLTDK